MSGTAAGGAHVVSQNLISKSNPLPSLCNMDESILAHIFSFLSPLPDLFNVTRSCKRFRDLAHTKRSWLVVSHDFTCPSLLFHHRHVFASLSAAVGASRPGDTVLLRPSPVPYDACDIRITHPLRIIGSGPAALCTLRSPPCAPALSFISTGRVANLTVAGGLGGCIAHYRGRLEIEECVLQCNARNLPHLAAPLLAWAASPPGNGAAKETAKKRRKNDGMSPGPGEIIVAATAMGGGSKAVHLGGTGVLRSVRAICEGRVTLFWFEIGSDDADVAAVQSGDAAPGVQQRQAVGMIREERCGAQGNEGPAWVGRAMGFDPTALQAHVAAVMSGGRRAAGVDLKLSSGVASLSGGGRFATAVAGPPGRFEVDVEKKAELWQRGHAASMRKRSGEEMQ